MWARIVQGMNSKGRMRLSVFASWQQAVPKLEGMMHGLQLTLNTAQRVTGMLDGRADGDKEREGHEPRGGACGHRCWRFSRQAMPNLEGTSREGAAKGGYIVYGGDAKPDVIIMSTGALWPWAPLPFERLPVVPGEKLKVIGAPRSVSSGCGR